MEGMGWRVSLSIAVSIGWIIFLIVWLFFYAGQSGYNAYQNFTIILISLLVLAILLGVPWAIWGRRHMRPEDREQWMLPGFRWRVAVSIVIIFAILIGLIYWFFFQAGDWSIYQNIAIVIVAILLLGGIMGAMWAPWGMKYGKK
jgi:hypothetical protein